MTLGDSSTYQLILKRGEARGEKIGEVRVSQSHALTLGTQRSGEPPAGTEEALRAITDRDRIERSVRRILTATDWADLLATQ